MLNVKVNYYIGSYQYAEPQTYTRETLEEIKEKVLVDLINTVCRMSYSPSGLNETVWATLAINGQMERLEDRVSIKPKNS